MKLWRAIGNFSSLAGTDRVVHFQAMSEDSIRMSADLFEIISFRKLGRALKDGVIEELDPRINSLYLLLGSILHRLVRRPGRSISTIFSVNDSFGPLLEALKLLSWRGSGRAVKYSPRCESVRYARGLKSLHGDGVGPGTGYFLGDVQIETIGMFRGISTGDRDLVVVDLVKQRSDLALPLLEKQFAYGDGAPKGALLLIVRAALQEGTNVTDVFGRRINLPSVGGIQEWCEAAGLTVSYLLLNDFDRSFFLPFNGDYALAVFYISSDRADSFQDMGFRAGDSRTYRGSTELTLFDAGTGAKNYDASFTAPLEMVDEVPEPNWRAWKEARDWNPAVVSWDGGEYPADLPVFGLHLYAGRRSYETQIQKLAMLSISEPVLSPVGLLFAAYGLHKSSWSGGLFCCLRAMRDTDHDPTFVEFLCRFVYEKANKPMPRAVDAFEAIDNLERGLGRVFETLHDTGWLAVGASLEMIQRTVTMAYGSDHPDAPRAANSATAVWNRLGVPIKPS